MKEFAGKVLIIVQNLPVPFDRRVWLEARTLTEYGYKVSVICPKSREYPKSFERIEGVAIYRYKIPLDAHGLLGYIFEFVYAWIVTALLSLRVLWREGFDVIQSCNPPDTYFLLARFYKLLGKRFIFDHHDLSPEMYLVKYGKMGGLLHRALLMLEYWTFRTADVVIATNDSYRDIAVSRGKKNPEDVFVVRTGPDLNRLKLKPQQPSLKQGRAHMICYLGEMCPQDGIDYLLRSADHLLNTIGRRDVIFKLIGGGPAMPKFKALSEAMGLNDSVVFTGRIPDEDLCSYLSTADVCVDPDPYSEWSNHSTMNKILEYMTFGKPIVTFDLKEARNSAQKAAVYVKPNSTRQFAETIHELLQNPQRCQSMGFYGRERIWRELAWSHTHKALLTAYRRVFQKQDEDSHSAEPDPVVAVPDEAFESILN